MMSPINSVGIRQDKSNFNTPMITPTGGMNNTLSDDRGQWRYMQKYIGNSDLGRSVTYLL